MKKIFNLILILGFSVMSFSQMYIGNGTYTFLNDSYMFITQDVSIQSGGHLYLRNTSQLLQGGTASLNSGNGVLSVFQEGTVNNFQYNYWCSPVGNGVGNGLANNRFGISLLHRPISLINSSPSQILPMSNYNGTSNPLAIAPYWIYKFITSSAYAQWVSVGGNQTLLPGEGFTMKGSAGNDLIVVDADGVPNNSGSSQRYDFRGRPNDGNISVAVLSDNFTLVGNPYPSAIDLNAYLLDPANAAVINGTAYFWEQSVVNSHYLNQYQGGYGKYTVGGGYLPADIWTYNGDGTFNTDTGINGNAYERRFTPIGQGFMVMGSSNGVATMRNSFRVFVKESVANSSEFARQQNSNSDIYNNTSEFFPEIPNVAGIDYTSVSKGYAPQVRINATVNDSGIIHTALGFGHQYTDGFDYSADARATSDNAPYSFYFVLNDSEHEFAMSLTSFDIEKKLPIGFRNNTPATFRIKSDQFLYGFDENINIYIHDKITDLYYDIKNNYFETSLPAGNNNTRYEITFQNSTLNNPDVTISNLEIFHNTDLSILQIENPNLTQISSITLHDVTGKLLLHLKNLEVKSNYQISTSNFSNGVYLVNVTNYENKKFSKKILK